MSDALTPELPRFYIRRVGEGETLEAFVARLRAHAPSGPLLEETPPRALPTHHACGAADWYVQPDGRRECRPCREATRRRRRKARP
jgi:hypothetical protein